MSEAFVKVKPLCVNLTRSCTVQDVEKLENVCQDLDDVSLQMLQEYLIFPLRFSLCKEINLSTVKRCVCFIQFIFRKTTLHSWTVFCDVLGQLFKIIWDAKASTLCDCSEELKQAVCDCVYVMVSHSTNEIHMKMFSKDFHLPLAQYLYVLLAILRNEKSKALQVSALRTLTVFCYSDGDQVQQENIRICAGARLSAFLPGITVRLCEIICGDDKLGHKIKVMALVLLREFLKLTVGDIYLNIDEINNPPSFPNANYPAEVPVVERNEAWIKGTSFKLEIVIKKAMTVVSHDHWKVRLTLCHFAETILCHCVVNLRSCVTAILQVLFVLSVDSFETIVAASLRAISKFSENVEVVKSFSPVLEEEIFSNSSRLIRLALATNDTQKLLLLKTILGYIKVLGTDVNNFLYSLPHLEKFLLSLLTLVKFDYNDFHFIQEHLPQNAALTDSLEQLWPRKQFLYFQNDNISNTVCEICRVLGCYGDVRLLVDFLLNEQKSRYEQESIYLIVQIISGLNDQASSTHLMKESKFDEFFNPKYRNEIINLVLEEFLVLLNGQDSKRVSLYSIHEVDNESIFQTCLILEAVAIFSEVLRSDFCLQLMHVLCPVIKKAGSSIVVVSQTAKLALNKVAYFCEYDTAAQLVIENADYLINSIVAEFAHLSENHEIFLVLQFVLEQSDVDVLPLFKDVIYYLFKMQDYYHDKALPIMRVFRSVISAVHRWYEPKVCKGNTKKINRKKSPGVKEAFLEHCQLKDIEASAFSDTIPKGNEELTNTPTDENEIASSDDLHLKLVTNILQRAIHHQSTNNLELCVLIMDIVGASLIALGNENDTILPYVHKYWSSFVIQFSQDTIIAMKAFETLIIISNECSDFVKSRMLKDIWPKLLDFLKCDKSSIIQEKHSAYKTNKFKMKILILSKIGHIAEKLELNEKEFELVVVQCLPYLSTNQPLSLQEAAQTCVHCLRNIDSDAYWFYANELC